MSTLGLGCMPEQARDVCASMGLHPQVEAEGAQQLALQAARACQHEAMGGLLHVVGRDDLAWQEVEEQEEQAPAWQRAALPALHAMVVFLGPEPQ